MDIDSLSDRIDSELPRKTKKTKKKSAVAKLAEKRRRAGSDFGSTTSLQSNISKNSEQVSPTSYDARRDHGISEVTDITTGVHSDERLDLSSSSGYKPLPRPRLLKRDKQRETRRTSLEVGASPREKQKHQETRRTSQEVGASPREKELSQTDPSQRLRSYKVVTQRSHSLESLKSSPFVPKPPTTPRGTGSPRKEVHHTGSKRGREFSSCEDLRKESKKYSNMSKKGSRNKIVPFDSDDDYDTRSKRTDLLVDNDSLVEHDSLGSVDIKRISDKYEQLLTSDRESSTPRTKNLSSLPPPSPRAKLDPISPKGMPPPLTHDISSQSLRTTYKTDPLFRRPPHVLERGLSNLSQSNIRNLHSQMSNAGSVVPTITTREARARSLSSCDINSGVKLLGAEELDRYFPERRMHILVGSWNMGEIKQCASVLNDFLLPERTEYVQDMYIIGTQEINMNRKEWEIKLQETLGPSHVLFHSITFGSLHLAVYLRRDLIWFCSVPEEDVVSTRAVTMVRTKGAVAIAFSFFGTSFLIINSHFTSDQGKNSDRMNDYKKIISSLKLPKSNDGSQSSLNSNSSNGEDATSKFDCVFWLGDLNFRIEQQLRTTVEDMVHHITSQEHADYDYLLRCDMLLRLLNEGDIFVGFQEGRIKFKPTYKFDYNTDSYDTSTKMRIPSYTDRILFRSKTKNTISCLHYDAVMSVKVSDHKPVYAIYETSIKPFQGDSIPLAGGQFDRVVYLEASKRRAERTPRTAVEKAEKRSSSVCSVQ